MDHSREAMLATGIGTDADVVNPLSLSTLSHEELSEAAVKIIPACQHQELVLMMAYMFRGSKHLDERKKLGELISGSSNGEQDNPVVQEHASESQRQCDRRKLNGNEQIVKRFFAQRPNEIAAPQGERFVDATSKVETPRVSNRDPSNRPRSFCRSDLPPFHSTVIPRPDLRLDYHFNQFREYQRRQGHLSNLPRIPPFPGFWNSQQQQFYNEHAFFRNSNPLPNYEQCTNSPENAELTIPSKKTGKKKQQKVDKSKKKSESQKQEVRWETYFDQLVNYHAEQGHCDVPLSQPLLGSWVSKQRQNYSLKKMPKDRIRRLEAMGFNWIKPKVKYSYQKHLVKTNSERWELRFQQLLDFKQEWGHCNVTRTFENRQLNRWLLNQRQKYQKNELEKERVERLESIGVIWDASDAVRHPYAVGEGGVVPRKRPAVQSLTNQKAPLVNENALESSEKQPLVSAEPPIEQSNAFVNVGAKKKCNEFRLNQLDRNWNEKLNELVKYKKTHGHTNVNRKHPILGVWVNHQRRFYKKGMMRENRMKQLEEIGFVFIKKCSDLGTGTKTAEEVWERRFNQLIEFKAKYGHCKASASSNAFLKNWLITQKKKYTEGVMSKEHALNFRAIGVDWAAPKKQSSTKTCKQGIKSKN